MPHMHPDCACVRVRARVCVCVCVYESVNVDFGYHSSILCQCPMAAVSH